MTAGQLRQINIVRFERLLAETDDPGRRNMIVRLLAEERRRFGGDAAGESRVVW